MTVVIVSVTIVTGHQEPMTGSRNAGSNSCPYAVTSVRNSSPKPTKTNQCATPTSVHCSIRVWPSVSRSIVSVRCAGAPVRGSGWPRRTTRTISATARATRATATSVTASETTIAAVCMGSCRGVEPLSGGAGRCLVRSSARQRTYICASTARPAAGDDGGTTGSARRWSRCGYGGRSAEPWCSRCWSCSAGRRRRRRPVRGSGSTPSAAPTGGRWGARSSPARSAPPRPGTPRRSPRSR